MKVLFLDIDGVLNSTRTAVAFGGYPMKLEHMGAFDQAAIRLIQRLCDLCGVQVVLSSAWRLHYPFREVGEALGLPIIDCTPYNGRERGSEIAEWMAAHPEVEQYAIIDDDADMLGGQLACFVRTNGHEGMTWADYSKLCEIFGESPFSGSPRERDWQKAALQAWDR